MDRWDHILHQLGMSDAENARRLRKNARNRAYYRRNADKIKAKINAKHRAANK